MFVKNTKLHKLKTHKQNTSSDLSSWLSRFWWFSTWKFESEENEKSLAIDDFLEQHDSEDTADTPGGGGDEVDHDEVDEDGDDEIEY